ncbi:MAG TPA: hypothetical protein VFQ61_37415 [Polyangiaceae bacterium]|nr:hypothetical protein [Polyangiaceae bacterium]
MRGESMNHERECREAEDATHQRGGDCARARMMAFVAVVGIVAGCRARQDAEHRAPEPVRSASYLRGDRVLVEARAAEFFEARVLTQQGDRLRLLRASGEDDLWVSRADVYRLPPESKGHAGPWAICSNEIEPGSGPSWIGCRITKESGDRLNVEMLDGRSLTLANRSVLRASPLTEMNLRRAFEQARARRDFLDRAAHAGRPHVPTGFRALPRMRVLALRRGGWYLGTVRELHKDGVDVAFESKTQYERIPAADLVPEPPMSEAPLRGSFALVRPLSPFDAWPVLRVAGVSDREFRVVNESGEERVVAPRDIVPLFP